MRNYDSGCRSRRNKRILASPDLSMAAPTVPTPPTALESVYSKDAKYFICRVDNCLCFITHTSVFILLSLLG